MSFTRFHIITDDDLHASLQCVRKIGSPQSHSASVTHVAEGGSSSGATPSLAGAAAASFNLDACMKMGEGFEE